MMPAPSKAVRPRATEKDHPAWSHLRGALHMIDQAKGRPSAELLVNIRLSVQSAVDVLLEKDPLKQRIAFILLAIKQSTHVYTKMVFGKPKEFATIKDPSLFAWAVHETHKIAGVSP